MPSTTLLSMATALTAVQAAYQGFNYGATFTDGTPKSQSDFEADFTNAANLDGTDGGFTSARLYTMIQGGTTNEPISAIPAAIRTKTTLLLGLWASAGDAVFANELAALHSVITQYCDQLDGLVGGISVGSEDLYRVTPIGQASNAGPGASAATLVGYIQQVRDAVRGSCLESAPVGHVDTWTAYVDGSNAAVIDACDFLGVDAYPYFESANGNDIANGLALFQAAMAKVQSVSKGKELWVTETGWPVSGPVSGDATASVQNAQTYWRQVGCPIFGKTNVWWYTMQDASPTTPSPSFGLVGSQLTTKPLYDLSCKDVKPVSSSASASASTAASTAASTSVASSASSGAPKTLPTTPGSPGAAPFPATNGTGTGYPASPTSGSGSGSGSASGSGSGSGSGSNNSGAGSGMGYSPSTSANNGASPSIPAANGGDRMSSFGAAAVALLLAAVAL